MDITRRSVLKVAALGALTVGAGARLSFAQATGGGAIAPTDRVFIANEDSNTISVIDPGTNTVDTTINLTSFDEDPRPPFRLITGGADSHFVLDWIKDDVEELKGQHRMTNVAILILGFIVGIIAENYLCTM